MTTAQEISRFHEHPVWRTLEQVVAQLESAKPRDSTTRHTIARAIATLQFAHEYRAINAHLFPIGRADVATTIENIANAISDQVDGWDQEGAMTSATSAQIDSYCDQVMGSINGASWPPLFKESRARAVTEAAAAFQTAAEQSLVGLEADVAGAREELRDIRSDVASLLAEAEAAQSRIEAANTSFDAEVSALRSRGDANLAEVIDDLEKKVEESRERQESAAQSRLARLEADSERGRDLVALIGDQAMGGGYDNFARSELRAFRFWSGVGVAVSLVAVIYLFTALFVFEHINTLTLQGVITRVALSLPILAIAGYAFQQASRRQRQSIEARYRALDVLAVEPFTQDMSVEQQTAMRVLLGQRLFGPGPNTGKATSNDDAPLPTPAQAQQLFELLKLFRPGS